jgi:hypothetical protein
MQRKKPNQTNLNPRGKYSESDKKPIRFSSTDQRKFATQLFRNHESLAEFKTAYSDQHQNLKELKKGNKKVTTAVKSPIVARTPQTGAGQQRV